MKHGNFEYSALEAEGTMGLNLYITGFHYHGMASKPNWIQLRF